MVEDPRTTLFDELLELGYDRSYPDGKASVVTVAATEPLVGLPAPFPAILAVDRAVSAQALVAFRGNHYSVPPEHTQVRVTHRLGTTHLNIATSAGTVIAAVA